MFPQLKGSKHIRQKQGEPHCHPALVQTTSWRSSQCCIAVIWWTRSSVQSCSLQTILHPHEVFVWNIPQQNSSKMRTATLFIHPQFHFRRCTCASLYYCCSLACGKLYFNRDVPFPDARFSKYLIVLWDHKYIWNHNLHKKTAVSALIFQRLIKHKGIYVIVLIQHARSKRRQLGFFP